MQVQINGSRIEIPSGVGLRVGELVEALAVHIEPGDVLTHVQLDGERFSADDHALATRSVEESSMLCLTTVPGYVSGNGPGDDVSLLLTLSTRIARATLLLQRREVEQAQDLLGELQEELHRALGLDE